MLFKACGNYLRKLSRRDGDVFERRYFYVGSRHGVRIYEPYNIQTNAQETNINQRLIWQEHRNMDFIAEHNVVLNLCLPITMTTWRRLHEKTDRNFMVYRGYKTLKTKNR